MPDQQPVSSSNTGDHPYPSLQQLQKLFDHSLDIICFIDGQGIFREVNAAAEQIWGYTPYELKGKRYIDFVIAADRAITLDVVAQVMQGYSTVNFENHYRHKNGTIIPIAWSAQWDAEDKVMFCIARNITERKAKEALQATYEKEIAKRHQELQEILERITDGFFALDTGWHFIYGNSQVERMLNRKWEDYLTKNYWECFPEAIGTIYEEQFLLAMHQNEPVQFDGWFAPFERWFSVNAYPSPSGLSVFFRDITDQKKLAEEQQLLEAKLVEQHEMMTEVLEQMGDGFIAVDWKGTIIYWNAAAENVTKVPREHILGKIIWEFFPGIRDSPYYLLYEELIATRKPLTREIFSPFTHRWVDLHGYVTNKGVSAFFRDITERKELEEEIKAHQKLTNAAVITAQEKERTQIGLELHDNVNQVLTTVKLYTELCRDGVGNTEEIMNRSIALLQESINEIRSLSKKLSAPTLGNIKLKESLLELIDAISATGKLKIETYADAIEGLEVDQQVHLALYRILQEQLTNILKHAAASEAKVYLYQDESNLAMVVMDNGKGFDIKEKHQGIGITNMTTRAESVKGSLVIKSKPAKGCELEVKIPLQNG